jgi:hypothetical protein
MRVLGLIEYNKEEERIIAESWVLGILVGVSLGVIVAIFFNMLQKMALQDPFGWLAANMPLFICIGGFWWLTTAIFSIALWRKAGTSFWGNVEKVLFPTLIIPIIWIYGLPIMAFIFNPLTDFLLQYCSPYGTFWIGAGVFLPFMLLYVYMILPDLRPRMRRNLRSAFTRGFWRRAWRNPKSRREIKMLLALFVILVVLHLWPMLT